MDAEKNRDQESGDIKNLNDLKNSQKERKNKKDLENNLRKPLKLSGPTSAYFGSVPLCSA